MTGRIKSLSARNESGFIEAENRLRFHFDSCAVLAYDVAFLAAGQPVSFDLEHGSEAVNICLQRSHPLPGADGKRKETTLRYMGFDQMKSIRTYRFERTSLAEKTEIFAVNTDMALFTKHRIGIQEGPALCLHLLMVELDATGNGPQLESSLTEQHMLTYLASKPVARMRPHYKSIPRPTANSDAH
jgi:hypothetical protein